MRIIIILYFVITRNARYIKCIQKFGSSIKIPSRREYVTMIRYRISLVNLGQAGFIFHEANSSRTFTLRDGRLERCTYMGHNIRRTVTVPVYYVPRVRRHAFQPSVSAPNNVPECQPKRFLASAVIPTINRSRTLAQTLLFFPPPFLVVLNLILLDQTGLHPKYL